MDVLFIIGQTFILGIIALFIIKWGHAHSVTILRLRGRLSRLQFVLGLFALYALLILFSIFTKSLMESVVILPAYWGVRLMIYAGHILLLPFFYVLYVRRLHDLSLPGLPGILWSVFIIFTHSYFSVKATMILFSVIMILVNLLLACIPGSSRPNKYGPPAIWPRKARRVTAP